MVVFHWVIWESKDGAEEGILETFEEYGGGQECASVLRGI